MKTLLDGMGRRSMDNLYVKCQNKLIKNMGMDEKERSESGD